MARPKDLDAILGIASLLGCHFTDRVAIEIDAGRTFQHLLQVKHLVHVIAEGLRYFGRSEPEIGCGEDVDMDADLQRVMITKTFGPALAQHFEQFTGGTEGQ
jgi:hypothetical protein